MLLCVDKVFGKRSIAITDPTRHDLERRRPVRNLKFEMIEYIKKIIWHSNPYLRPLRSLHNRRSTQAETFQVFYLSVLAVAAVLLALTATPVAFAKEKHHARKALQSVSEQIRYTGAAVIDLPARPSNYLGRSLMLRAAASRSRRALPA